ncbi:hypothetical protein [Streptosporangium sp. NPDC048865]|uniref:DUF6197 family protein n=1 Tax=Streptosporangium sp. NPDC048865 TaxID=3155766 RepID=UPI00343028E2
MYETRTYDDEHGQPVVVLVATGGYDVARLTYLLQQGNCEQGSLSEQITRQVKRHHGGRAALRLLADHGGPDLLTRVGETPPMFDVAADMPTLPGDGDAAPALRMLKAYAARTLYAYALAHKTYPSLSRPQVREERNRWELRYSFASYAFGVVFLLRELIEHDPDKADELAQLLANAWGDAEASEVVRDWLSEWGIDAEKIVQEAFEDAKTADADLGVGGALGLSPEAVLSRAADVIDRNGLAPQGYTYLPQDGKSPRDCPVDALGAVAVAAGLHPTAWLDGPQRLDLTAFHAAAERLGDLLTDETDASKVTAVLRAAAGHQVGAPAEEVKADA